MAEDRMFGYVRVSTLMQREDRQLIAMREFGVPEGQIYTDKQSGKDFQRPAYQKLIGRLESDDVLVIQSIDRLGRDYQEIGAQWRIITKEKGAAIVVLDMPLLDTRQKDRDLTGTFVADLVLSILSYVAETERRFLHKRQAEGIAAAKAKGVRFGRPAVEPTELFYTLAKEWEGGEISAREGARQLGIHHKTFLSLIRKK
ncbi:MAG: recombinase family protein [Clostridiales bacterium]|jgi:DNA invertase Pin-like site-specific DNA recombinase|nr:recombinase family protein [Clostridiales bacterium]